MEKYDLADILLVLEVKGREDKEGIKRVENSKYLEEISSKCLS